MFGIIPCHFLRGPVPTTIWVWFHIAKKLSPCNNNSSLGKKLVSCVLIHWFSNSLMFLNPSMSFFERKKTTLAFFLMVPTTIYIWFKCLQRISPCRKVNSVRKAYLKFMKFSSEKKTRNCHHLDRLRCRTSISWRGFVFWGVFFGSVPGKKVCYFAEKTPASS